MNSSHSTKVHRYVPHPQDLSRHLCIFIYLFYLIVGNIGLIFKMIFFLQKPVRTCPCVIYVLAATIMDFITLNNIPILQLLSSLYPSKKWISMTINRSILSQRQYEEPFLVSSRMKKICQIRSSIHMWSTDLSIYLLVLASINRYLMSSKKLKQKLNWRLLNTFCNFSNAIRISLATSIIGALFSLHHYLNFTLVANYCRPKYFILWMTWIFDVHCLIPSTLMIIFSTLTLINRRKSSRLSIRQRRSTYGSMSNSSNRPLNMRFRRHHIEQQLTSMIIAETMVTVLTTLPYTIYVLYQAMRTEYAKKLETLVREDLIEQLVRSTMYFEPSCGFYIYLFTLKTLRKRFIRILLNKFRFI